MAASDIALVNQPTGAPIASSVERATTRTGRKRGLLGRDGMLAGSALMIEQCLAVHTTFLSNDTSNVPEAEQAGRRRVIAAHAN
jgi:hypothetical protein